MELVQNGLEFGRYETEKGQVNRGEHSQYEIHDCCFPEFWSFIGRKTPDTQNATLKDKM